MNFFKGSLLGFDVDKEIYNAAEKEDLAALNKILNSNANFNLEYQYSDVYSPLMVACESGNITIMRALLEAGANINATSIRFGSTALSRACRFGHTDLVKYMLENYKVDVNNQSKTGWSALMQAAFNRQEDIVKLLLTVPDIDIHLSDEKGQTAYLVAKTEAIKELLIKFDNTAMRASFSPPTTPFHYSPRASLVTPGVDNSTHLEKLQAQYHEVVQQMPSVTERQAWVQQRNTLQAKLEVARAESQFTLCATLGKELTALLDGSALIALSEEDFLSLPHRLHELQSDLQEHCHELVGSMDYDTLDVAAALLTKVDALVQSSKELLGANDSDNKDAIYVPRHRTASMESFSCTTATRSELEKKVQTLQATIDNLTTSLVKKEATITALAADLVKLRCLRASPVPVPNFASCSLDPVVPKPVARRGEFEADEGRDGRWL